MPDDFHLSGIVVAFLAVILMVIVPSYNMLQKHEQLVQNYVEYKTELFSDTIKSSGKITKLIYEQYVHQLDSTGFIYDIQIEHRKKVIVPNYSEDYIFQDSYSDYYEYVDMEDILDELYASGEYRLTFGDYVTVSVKSRTTTRSGSILSAFMGRGASTSNYIMYADGGLIWNEAY